jgi:hypothetical protein
VTALPREARDGLMRAWLKVLSDRHPHITWLPEHASRGTLNERKEDEAIVSQ